MKIMKDEEPPSSCISIEVKSLEYFNVNKTLHDPALIGCPSKLETLSDHPKTPSSYSSQITVTLTEYGFKIGGYIRIQIESFNTVYKGLQNWL